jgi:hypothetical protein
MNLDVNKTDLTIVGVEFDNRRDFSGVRHALSTNMFEGWEPTRADVLRLKRKVETLREEADDAQTV